MRHDKFPYPMVYLSLALFLAIIYILVTWQYYQKKELYFHERSHIFQQGYNTILEGFRERSQLLFEYALGTDTITSYMYQAIQSSTEEEQDSIRKKLQVHVDSIYKTLTKYSFRQVHYHLPNNHSFLRMHRPRKFGDDLTGIRKTIEVTNREKRFVQGFEEGRIFNGYRYVYPLFHNKKHVGSVEISVNLNAAGKIIQRLYEKEWALLLDRTVVNKKVFSSERENYLLFPVDSHFVIDQKVCSKEFLPTLTQILSKDKQWLGVQKVLQQKKAGVEFIHQKKEKDQIIISLPIINFEGKSVGALVTIGPDERFILFQRDLFIQLVAITVTFSLLFLAVYKYHTYRQKVINEEKFLPVCSICHKIREKEGDPYEQNSWLSPEKYFHKHEDIDFSHSLCPSCIKEHYGEYDDEYNERG